MNLDLVPALEAVSDELRIWRRHGAAPQLWWRDDDAHVESPQLVRLCELLAGETLVLAVIPGLLTDGLVRMLEGRPQVSVAQHGWKHINHAPPDVWPCEFPGGRDRAEVERELREGREVLRRAFGPRFLPMLAPPWNTLAGWVFRKSREFGYSALSLGRMRHPFSGRGYAREVNAEIDIGDWNREGEFVGAERLGAALLAALRARREAEDWHEPLGVNSHHLRMASEDFDVLGEFVRLFRDAGVVWASPQSLVS